VFSCSKIEQKQLNTWVSFQSAEQPLLGQFSVSGNNAEEVEADNVSPVQLPGEQTVATSVPRSPDDQAETPAFISPFSVSLRKLRESGIELGMLHVIHPY